MALFTENVITQLAELLKEEKEDEVESSSISIRSPGDIPTPSVNVTTINKADRKDCPPLANFKNIWEPEEVKEEADSEIHCLGIKPKYEMFFKQRVTPEDIFLQMGNKTPCSASCEYLVIKVKMPDTPSMDDIVLDVSDETLDCRTKVYKLLLNLPNKVNPRESKAEWNGFASELTITLTLVREYDYINF